MQIPPKKFTIRVTEVQCFREDSPSFRSDVARAHGDVSSWDCNLVAKHKQKTNVRKLFTNLIFDKLIVKVGKSYIHVSNESDCEMRVNDEKRELFCKYVEPRD